ncbi:MAG: signal transduction histidine kinase [Pseudohongiellaceae bacterium]
MKDYSVFFGCLDIVKVRILFVLCFSFLSHSGYGAEPITHLWGASNWSEAVGIVASGSGVAIDSVINFDGKEAWLHLQIPPGEPIVLYLDNPTVRNYEIISLASGEILYRGGLDAGQASRAVFYPDFLYPIPGAWDNDLLLRVDAINGDLALAIRFLTVRQVTRVTAIRFLGDGMYYGVITLLIIFSFFVTLSNGYGHARRLGICLLAWLLTMITVSGYGNLLVWPNTPEVGTRLYPIFTFFAALSTAWFAWHFLRKSAEDSFFLKGVRFCIWLNCFMLLLSAVLILALPVVMLSMVTTGVFIAFAASVSALRGDIASRYLVVAIVIAVAPFPITGEFPMAKNFIAVCGTVSLLFVIAAVLTRLVQHSQKQSIEARVVVTRAKFLASMSHEIRTPLNGVIGFSELCAQEELSADAADYVSQIQRSSKLLLNVVNEVLDFSKLEAGAVEVSLKSMNLKDTIDNIVATLGPMVSENNVKLGVSIDYGVAIYVVTDPVRCSQILINLLSNAIKFSKNGAVYLSVQQKSGRLEFTVQDTGIGIAQNSIQLLFDPYHQVLSGNVNSFGGTGLGLSIAKQFSDLLGGTISVKSEVGKGSIFTLQIPYKEGVAPELNPIKISDAHIALTGVTVLVAEDNEVNQFLVRKILEGIGVIVESAENGKVALDLAVVSKYDVILMDVQMPRMNGIEATRQLRDRGCDTPIVALTANNSEFDMSACADAGMSDFLAKPFVQADLIGKIERWARAAPDPH